MKELKAQCNYVPERNSHLLTALKWYKVISYQHTIASGYLMRVLDDTGEDIYILQHGCAFLDNGKWIVTEDK